MVESHLPRELGIAHYQFVDAFGLQAVHLVVEDCSFCELAAFGHSKSQPFELLEYGFDDCSASVDVQLYYILAIVAAITREVYHHALVDELFGLGINRPQMSHPPLN